MKTAIKKEHINKWVVVTPDYKTLLGAENTLSQVIAKTAKFKKRLVIKVLPSLGYVPALNF